MVKTVIHYEHNIHYGSNLEKILSKGDFKILITEPAKIDTSFFMNRLDDDFNYPISLRITLKLKSGNQIQHNFQGIIKYNMEDAKKLMDDFNATRDNDLIGKNVIAYKLRDQYIGIEKAN